MGKVCSVGTLVERTLEPDDERSGGGLEAGSKRRSGGKASLVHVQYLGRGYLGVYHGEAGFYKSLRDQ